MRRDPDILLQVLKDIADSPFNHEKAPLALADGPLFKGTETERGKKNQIEAEHIRWMLDAGWLSKLGGHYVRITSAGMDFLESAEQDGVWEETNKVVAETSGSVALEVIKALAMGFAKKKLKQHTDFDL